MNEKKFPLPKPAAKAGLQVICEAMKQRRIQLNLSQEELAERMQVRQETISRMENAQFNVSIENLMNWCYCLFANPFIQFLEDNGPDHEKAMADLGRRPDELGEVKTEK